MSPWMFAVVLRYPVFILLMGLLVIPIELALCRVWPEGPVKRVLFGRNFDKRHPRLWIALIVTAYAVVGLLVWVYVTLVR